MFQHILEEAARVTNLWGGRLIFVYLPAYSRYAGLRWGNPDRGRILSLVKHMGLAVINLQPVFAAHRNPIALFPFARPGHYTVEGNHLIAEAILSALTHRPELSERDLNKRPWCTWETGRRTQTAVHAEEFHDGGSRSCGNVEKTEGRALSAQGFIRRKASGWTMKLCDQPH
jgi:hypothetical protein